MTWGILAYLATTPRARRYLSIGSSVVALGVGATTVYLGTHWLSDVLLGWVAGLLILLALPWFEPTIARTETAVFALREQWRERRRTVSEPAAAGEPWPVIVPQLPAQEGEDAVRSPVGTAHSGRNTTGRNTTAQLTQPRPHATARSERTPTAPAGSRRPPRSRPVTGG